MTLSSSPLPPVFCSRCGQTPLKPGRRPGVCGFCQRRRRIEREAHAFVALPHQSWVILDTETTGLAVGQEEVIDLAILFADGTPLFSSLLRPLAHQVDGSPAQLIHHITDQELSQAPTFAEMWPRLENLLHAVQTVITYNAPFDRQMLESSARLAKVSLPRHLDWWCLMDAFAHWHGDARTIRRGWYDKTVYRSHTLSLACQELGIDTHPLLSEHRALGDAQRAHAVLLALARRWPEPKTRRRQTA